MAESIEAESNTDQELLSMPPIDVAAAIRSFDQNIPSKVPGLPQAVGARRLNPKLTRRRVARPDPPPAVLAGPSDEYDTESSNSDSDFDPDSFETPDIERGRGDEKDGEKTKSGVKSSKAHQNGALGMQDMIAMGNTRQKHDGKFIEKVFKVGRAVPLTGIWSCCGSTMPLSLYCESAKARKEMKAIFAAAAKTSEQLQAYRDSKKASRAKWDALSGTRGTFEGIRSAEDIAMENVEKTDSNFNAPMLSSWLFKNVHEEPTVTTGMQFLQNHLDTGEGCELMVKHDILGAIRRVHEFYRDNPPMQLHCVIALRKLLDCNFTRDGLTRNSTVALRLAFSIAHIHMNSRAHVEAGTRCVAQCARSEVCRADIFNRKMYAYVIHFCKRFHKAADIVRPALLLINWVATTDERIVELCRDGGVIPVILKVMKKHAGNGGVLGPGMLFLTRAAAKYAPAMATILRMRATPMIIRALMALYSDELLQLEGLKMIQTISKTAEGWRQITETRGGWQALTQGTSIGNALVHDLPGELNNPGWAIGDTPNLPLADQQKLQAAQVLLNRSKGLAPTASWTPHALRDFMGISMKESKLSVNTEYHDTYFELLSTLELLPLPGEEREYWFVRVKDYEKRSNILIDEMVHTMIDLKHKEENDRKAAELAKLNPPVDVAKSIYVLGNKIDGTLLSGTDLTLQEIMRGETSN